ncbi:MAG TPA: hypothetical protein VNI83_02210 [Vicinamibacterales bacterium]|nr:hypothetical protein [Vicinamibacterales bacterium]
MTDMIETALNELLARRERRAHPRGSFDNGGRWWPAAEEEQVCCRRVRTPSRSFPYSLLTHCRTVEHVAMLYGVPAGTLRRAVRAAKPPAGNTLQ